MCLQQHLNSQVLCTDAVRNAPHSGLPQSHSARNSQERQLMTPDKQVARRLALYLRSIGISPSLQSASYKQWGARYKFNTTRLESTSELARQTGRRLMRSLGRSQEPLHRSQIRVFNRPWWLPSPSTSSNPIQAGVVSQQDQPLVTSDAPLPVLRMGGGFPSVPGLAGIGRGGLGKTARSGTLCASSSARSNLVFGISSCPSAHCLGRPPIDPFSLDSTPSVPGNSV